MIHELSHKEILLHIPVIPEDRKGRASDIPSVFLYQYSLLEELRLQLNSKEEHPFLVIGPGFQNATAEFQELLTHTFGYPKEQLFSDPFPSFSSLLRHSTNSNWLKDGALILSLRSILSDELLYQFVRNGIQRGEFSYLDLPEENFYRLHFDRQDRVKIQFRIFLTGTPTDLEILKRLDAYYSRTFPIEVHGEESASIDSDFYSKFSEFVSSWREGSDCRCNAEALASLVKIGSGLIESRSRFPLEFSDLIQIERMATLLCPAKSELAGSDIAHAFRHLQHTRSREKKKYHDDLRKGIYNLSFSEAKIGRVHALSVVPCDDVFSDFGEVNQVSARISVGTGNFVNIEREVNLSGDLHDKGILILQSYLKGLFGNVSSFGLDASIVFEQNVAHVDGDSASVAELMALLSALSEIPIPGDIAITGALSQYGDVTAVGSINRKITTWWEVCQILGENDREFRVFIPESNRNEINLPEEVELAVLEGKLRIYAYRHVEELVWELMGVHCGELDQEGKYPEGTLFHRIQEKIEKKRDPGEEEMEV